MNATPLRDQRIGRLLAKRGCRALSQAEEGGTPLANVIRMAEWRNRFAIAPPSNDPPPFGPIMRPIEETMKRKF